METGGASEGPGAPSTFPARGRAAALAVLSLVVVIPWAVVIIRAPGDFGNHVVFARRLLEGRFLYEGGLDVPYTPLWALAHVPFTLVPLRLAQALVYPLGIGATAGLLALLRRLAPGPALPQRTLLAVDAAALFLASRFLLRDLLDGGPNTVILALSWLGLFLLARRREVAAGAALGLATALKWTPALFLAFLVWKRRWRAAAAGLAFAGLFTLAPALVQGPSALARHLAVWAGGVVRGVASPDPRVGVLGVEPPNNLALRPVLGRLLARTPAPDTGPPVTPSARAAAVGLPLLLAAAVAWRCRAPFRDGQEAPAVEWAAAGLLALLLSPVSWHAHAVASLPALWLLVHAAVRRGRATRADVALLVPWATLLLVLNRTFAGEAFTGRLHELGVFTALLVALLARTLAVARETGAPADAP